MICGPGKPSLALAGRVQSIRHRHRASLVEVLIVAPPLALPRSASKRRRRRNPPPTTAVAAAVLHRRAATASLLARAATASLLARADSVLSWTTGTTSPSYVQPRRHGQRLGYNDERRNILSWSC